MYRSSGVILGLVFLAGCVTGVAGGDTTKDGVLVTEKENGSRVEMSKGALLTIRLETVPGTGYDWKLVKSDPAKLKLLREDLEIAPRSMPGSAARKVFRFMSEQSGPSTVELHYVRPWEKDVAPRKTYKIEVDAK